MRPCALLYLLFGIQLSKHDDKPASVGRKLLACAEVCGISHAIRQFAVLNQINTVKIQNSYLYSTNIYS